MRLTIKMHDAVRDSDVGIFLSRLIAEEVARGGDTCVPYKDGEEGGNIIQRLWGAFMKGAGEPYEVEYEEWKGFD